MKGSISNNKGLIIGSINNNRGQTTGPVKNKGLTTDPISSTGLTTGQINNRALTTGQINNRGLTAGLINSSLDLMTGTMNSKQDPGHKIDPINSRDLITDPINSSQYQITGIINSRKMRSRWKEIGICDHIGLIKGGSRIETLETMTMTTGIEEGSKKTLVGEIMVTGLNEIEVRSGGQGITDKTFGRIAEMTSLKSMRNMANLVYRYVTMMDLQVNILEALTMVLWIKSHSGHWKMTTEWIRINDSARKESRKAMKETGITMGTRMKLLHPQDLLFPLWTGSHMTTAFHPMSLMIGTLHLKMIATLHAWTIGILLQ